VRSSDEDGSGEGVRGSKKRQKAKGNVKGTFKKNMCIERGKRKDTPYPALFNDHKTKCHSERRRKRKTQEINPLKPTQSQSLNAHYKAQ
jgi:hypothetical protein